MTNSISYLIPSKTQRVEIVVVNSRFIGTAGYAPSVDAAKSFVTAIRTEMPDASHHVYAFRVGYGNSVTEGMSDDGEPSGTAGPPALAVLRGKDIGDTVVVVTRYFGGTLLGTGGLVRAYSDAVKAVLSELPLERKIERKTVGVEMPYPAYQLVRRAVDRYQAIDIEETFEATVTITARFPVDVIPDFLAEVIEISSGTVQPILLD
jgi:uncharacterized YigZ family protein